MEFASGIDFFNHNANGLRFQGKSDWVSDFHNPLFLWGVYPSLRFASEWLMCFISFKLLISSFF
jgi:hypothetical protein